MSNSTYANRPNVLLMMTDQHRHDHVGTLANRARTPHLDRLASQGCLMENAYSPIPLCVPARCAVMSGRYASSLGFTDNESRLTAEDATLASSLAEAGYERALVGKNHAYSTVDLQHWDFVELYAFHGKETEGSHTPPTDADDTIRRWRTQGVPYFESAIHEPQPGAASDDPTVRQTDDALRYLKTRDTSRPFFMYLSYEAPHFPYVLPEPWFSRIDPNAMPGPGEGAPIFAGKSARLRAQWHGLGLDWARAEDFCRVQATYRGMVEMVDQQIGRVMKVLEDQGELEKTLIVFCSDHGDFLGQFGLIGKTVGLYESLLRVPMILVGPGIPSGMKHQAYVDLTDVTPTLLELGRLPPLPKAQGRSFANVLGDAGGGHRRWIVAEHAMGRERGMAVPEIEAALLRREELEAMNGDGWFLDLICGRTQSLLDSRTGTKLIRWDGSPDELYQLHKDPDETCNVSQMESELRDAMLVRLNSVDLSDPQIFDCLAAL